MQKSDNEEIGEGLSFQLPVPESLLPVYLCLMIKALAA